MAQKRRAYNNNNKRNKRAERPSFLRPEPAVPYVPKPPVTYGQPVMLLEDTLRNTFEYKRGAWIPFAMSIADCRRDCLVKELSQKVNQMTRYEVRFPV
jgi:hypothetical protein